MGRFIQAFLSALSYHRWHAPVSATVIDVMQIPGTYYSRSPTCTSVVDSCVGNKDPSPPDRSQAYLSLMATRLIFLFEADNPDIGMVCFLAIGMAEVSSCDAFVLKGQHVTAGDQIGTFRYGGLSYCLLFEPHCHLEFAQESPSGSWHDHDHNNPVRSLLATAP